MKKRVLITVLVLLVCAFALAGCGDSGQDVQTDVPSETVEETTAVPDIVLAEGGKSNYKIVYAEGCSVTVKDAAIAVFGAIGSFKTENLEMIYDKGGPEQDPDAFEIVIGDAEREGIDSVKSMLKMPHDYVVTQVGNRIFIYSSSEEQLLAACNDFAAAVKNDNGRKTVALSDIAYHSYEYPAAGMSISGTPVSEFSIVCNENDANAKAVAEEIQSLVYGNTGYLLPLKTSSETESTNEILVGDCGRGETSKYYTGADALEYGEYAVETAGGKLICAFHTSAKRKLNEKLTEILGVAKVENISLRESAVKKLDSLDGKTVLFVGNSHTYYGGCVTTVRGPSSHDTGWFYKVAKAMGDSVTVVNMTYPGEKITQLYERLAAQDAEWFEKFDAVVLQNAGTSNDSTALPYSRKIRELFPADTVFAFVITEYCVRNNQTYTLNAAETLKEEGMLIADWGHTAWDLMDGKVSGSKYKYPVTSFRVNKSDTFHPNPLSGYITAITCYGTLTGRKTEGSDYSFITSSYLKSYISTYYVSASDTNIVEIFADSEEMRLIQATVDKRVAEVSGR